MIQFEGRITGATPQQERRLRQNGVWRDGLSFAEASRIDSATLEIDTAYPNFFRRLLNMPTTEGNVVRDKVVEEGLRWHPGSLANIAATFPSLAIPRQAYSGRAASMP